LAPPVSKSAPNRSSVRAIGGGRGHRWFCQVRTIRRRRELLKDIYAWRQGELWIIDGRIELQPFRNGYAALLNTRLETALSKLIIATNCDGDQWRFAIACTVWGDLFNRPVYGVVRQGNVRE